MSIVPDALFPTDNEYGIPMLDPLYQADFVDAPVRGWGSVSRASRMRGVWHFYVDDYKFGSLWKSPEKMLGTKAVGFVEPNFTVQDQMPMAVTLWRLYQKRWLSRYWQENEYKCFVDLNVDPRYAELNMLGVPKGWNAFATAAVDSRIELLEDQLALAKKWAGGKFLMLVYGGGPKVRVMCEHPHIIHIEEARTAARRENNG